MAARVVELCEAIKDYIKSQTYSFTIETLRTNFIVKDLKDTNFTKVYVYPATPTGSSTQIATRDSFLRHYQVNVHVTNFIDGPTQTEIDNALLLAEELEQSLENVELAGFEMLSFASETGGRAFFEMEDAIERNYYHAIITINYLGTL